MDAHRARCAPDPRRLPPDRRRVPRPGPLRARLAARRPRPAQRGPRGQRRDRQRRRQRRRRRQGDLPVRAGDDRVLPRRAPAAAERRDLRPLRPRPAPPRPRPPRRDGGQAGRRVRWLRARDRYLGDRTGARAGRRHDPGRPAGVGGATDRHPVDLPHPGRRVGARTPARRPPAVRGQRRRRDLRAPGRPHPGRSAQGEPRRELLAGRRLQGHLGARRGRPRRRRRRSRGAPAGDPGTPQRGRPPERTHHGRGPAEAAGGPAAATASGRPSTGGPPC